MCRDERFHATKDDPEGAAAGFAWSRIDRDADLVGDLDLAGVQALWRSKHRAGALPRRSDFTLIELSPWLGRVCFVHPLEDGDSAIEIAGCEVLTSAGEPAAPRLSGSAPFPDSLGADMPYAFARRHRVGVYANGRGRGPSDTPVDWRGIVLPLAGDVLLTCFVATDGD